MSPSTDDRQGAGGVDASRPRWSEVAEDTVGFGQLEWNTARDMLSRPRVALERYLTEGPTGGGRYRRPLGFYMALNGIMLFWLWLAGGADERLLATVPSEVLARGAARAGKSIEMFRVDVGDAITALLVPIGATLYVAGMMPFFRRWLGASRGVATRATLAFLCIWSVTLILLGPLPYLPELAKALSFVTFALMPLAFWRAGRGLLWRTTGQLVARALLLTIVLFVAGLLNGFITAVLATLVAIVMP